MQYNGKYQLGLSLGVDVVVLSPVLPLYVLVCLLQYSVDFVSYAESYDILDDGSALGSIENALTNTTNNGQDRWLYDRCCEIQS